MANRFFITGTDTGIGKTVVSAPSLCVARRDLLEADPDGNARGHGPENRDETGRNFGEPDYFLKFTVLLRRFRLIWPHGSPEFRLNSKDSDAGYRRREGLIVEGAGGALVPINRTQLNDGIDEAFETARATGFAHLTGTINHTLLSLAAFERRGLHVRGVVMVGKPNARTGRPSSNMAKSRSIGASDPRHNKSRDADRRFSETFRSRGFPRMNSELRIWHPFTQEALDPPPIRIASARGAYLYTDDGRRLIDAISSWWVNIHGHCHPAIMEAIAEQTRNRSRAARGFTHAGVEELCGLLQKVLPGVLNIFSSPIMGRRPWKCALKMARSILAEYWTAGEEVDRRARHAYHGDTVGAMSVSAQSVFTDPFRGLMFPVHRVHSAHCHRCPVGKSRATCRISIAHINSLKAARRETRRDCGCDPRAITAGRRRNDHPSSGISAGVRKLCSEYDVLLIADEVLTGFGRTGKMFACELANVAPDLMCLSKGITGGVLPMGATVAPQRFIVHS